MKFSHKLIYVSLLNVLFFSTTHADYQELPRNKTKENVKLTQPIVNKFIAKENELLVDDNPDYRMVIDKTTVKPITLTLKNGIKKKVVQGVVYVFYKTAYTPYTLNAEDEKTFSINKYMTYVSPNDYTSAEKSFDFYDENGSPVDYINSPLALSDFKKIRPKTIGDIQFKILKENAQN